MRLRAGRRTLCLALLLLATTAAAQRPRRPVKVEFRIVEATYRPSLDSAEALRLQDSATASLAALLADRLPFLSFERADSDSTLLIVALDRRDRGSTAPIVEVGFHATLVRPRSDSSHIYWMMFRPAEAALQGVGTPDALLAEIRARFERLSEADWTRLVGDLLSRVPIADTAAMWAQPLGWIIPYQRRDLCLDPTSVLRVDNVVLRSFGTEQQTVVIDATGTFDPPAQTLSPTLERMRKSILGLPRDRVTLSPDSVQVKAVYVSEYRLSREACPKLLAPMSPEP